VIKQTGYPVGGVPPFGHQNPIRAYMQADLLTADEVYAGGGAADHLLRVSPQEILRLSAASVIQLQQEA
jgi:prolyl-tRNA editing enzyme YbaK/EbsC (Cys-tRNA(Pro) deacylase)